MKMKKFYFLACCLLLVNLLPAQKEVTMPAIPAMRQLHHDNILASMQTIARLHSRKDTILPITEDPRLNAAINRSVRISVNNMRAEIELNESLDVNAKYKWLRGVNEMLQGFISQYRAKIVKSVTLPALVKAYSDAMKLDIQGKSIATVVSDYELEVGNILLDNFAFKDNVGMRDAKEMLVLKTCQRDPGNILRVLSKYPEISFADSLIVSAAFHDQEEFYNYAAAPDALGKRIRAVDNPLVKMISQLAMNKTGRMYFPFLDDLYRGKITMDSIRPYVLNDSSDGYYKLLVKTRIGYAERIRQGDTPMVADVLTEKLRFKAVERYITEINALHDVANENIRFKRLDPLNSQELYYLAVLGEEEIYTSSFVSGVYPRIFKRMKHPGSDTLLQLVHYDFYKKFIKMSAAYNTLDDFLKRMNKERSDKLMQQFVDGLERTKTLEDAVDVADSYASIYNKQTRKLILNEVQKNLQSSQQEGNKRGEVIYHLLNTIFLSMDSVNHIDVSATLGIDPVYYMPASLLKDDKGRIIMQQFSYGDKDAKNYFSAFMARFSNANWRITRTPNWVEINSVKGTPVTIYANLPLDEKEELDTKAQDSLISYMYEREIEPTVVIHRGHSYYLQETIDRLPSSAKVVLLGSCGGYQKLNDVLKICPRAQIISSKQTGTGSVNQGLIDAISDRLRLGKDLNWDELWRGLKARFSGSGMKEKFDDYIPPHKNLGAIFIMAYTKAMKSSGTE
ncbi:hypothetical protein [Sediminibacterium ginsengisoli]|uniref:CHAT domain-containing protein n=1 Tax=Sediminibacterium ginsengisoli TaxID=413434 RepID=A0A1T4NJ20_9BACT|nr:hypothetical protein [Sediminibacterium ginsengisoli]SJZ79244.1 hypothetical protein SAMN04488132_104283 [Sediminibacterium ginsengisoli]